MILSRFWYAVLALLFGATAFILLLSVQLYNRAGNRAMSVSTVNQSGQFTIGYTIYPQPGFDPVFGGATVNALTGSGTGECFAPGLLDCGEFTIQKVSCSLAATRQPRAGTGRVMGKR